MPRLVYMLEGLEGCALMPEEYYDRSKDTEFVTNWGFTIYRTYYGPSSTENWNTLITTIEREAYEALTNEVDLEFQTESIPLARKEAERDAAEQLKPIFRLDARSDESLLSSADRRRLSEIYTHRIGGKPVYQQESMVFLYADEDVLNQIGQGIFVVKAVDAEEAAEDHGPTPEDSSYAKYPAYWGWMRMETRQVLELWAGVNDCRAYHNFEKAVNEDDLNHKIYKGNYAD